MMSRLLLLSNSVLHGSATLEWCRDNVKSFLEKYAVNKVLFIPYAKRDYDKYTEIISAALKNIDVEVEGIHKKDDPVVAVNECQGIFIGGGNTFLLLKTLYEKKLIEPIRQNIFQRNIPYMGCSAGTNVATLSICTTNDMPICYPPSFEALKLVPFNINPHYVDADPSSKHMGETRETRIKEFHENPDSPPVLGLKEGSLLLVEESKATLLGPSSAKLFQRGKEPISYQAGDDLSFLLTV